MFKWILDLRIRVTPFGLGPHKGIRCGALRPSVGKRHPDDRGDPHGNSQRFGRRESGTGSCQPTGEICVTPTNGAGRQTASGGMPRWLVSRCRADAGFIPARRKHARGPAQAASAVGGSGHAWRQSKITVMRECGRPAGTGFEGGGRPRSGRHRR